MDVDVPAGIDYRQFFRKSIGDCSVVLAVIGDHWLTATDEAGNRRLDQEQDFVRIEIQSALELNKPVIPLLVGRASMPISSNLPPSIDGLSFRQSAEVRSGTQLQSHLKSLAMRVEELLTENELIPIVQPIELDPHSIEMSESAVSHHPHD